MWNDLTSGQKADIIGMAAQQGITNIRDIEALYNESVSGHSYASGGNMGEYSSKEEMEQDILAFQMEEFEKDKREYYIRQEMEREEAEHKYAFGGEMIDKIKSVTKDIYRKADKSIEENITKPLTDEVLTPIREKVFDPVRNKTILFLADSLLKDENRKKAYHKKYDKDYVSDIDIDNLEDADKVEPEYGVRKIAKMYSEEEKRTEAKNALNAMSKYEVKKLQDELAKEGYFNEKLIGSKEKIKEMQVKLQNLGYLEDGKNQIDGVVGNKTQTAYNKYLADKNIDGIVGPKTLNAYYSKNYGGYGKDVTTKGVDGCAQWVTKKYESANNNRSLQNGVVGNAWQMIKNIEDRGGTMLYNIYDDSFNDIKDVNTLKQRTLHAANEHKLDYNSLKVGDIVGIYMPSSNMHSVALAEGTTKNTHVGIVTGFDSKGVPIIEHNIHQSHRKDPITKLTGSRSGRAIVTAAVRPRENPETQMVKETKWDLKPSKYVVEGGNKEINTYAQSIEGIKDQISQMYSNINVDDVEQIALAVQKRETGFMENRKSQQKGWNKFKNWVGDTARKIKGISAEQTSSDLAKFKFNSLRQEEREFLGIRNTDDLNDPKKAGAAAALYLARQMSYLQRLQEKYPKLGLTDEDVYNLTVLSYNQSIQDLGFTNGKLNPEEIERVREYYDTEKIFKDVNSTNYRHLGLLGDIIYDRFGKGNKSYIASALDARNELKQQFAYGGYMNSQDPYTEPFEDWYIQQQGHTFKDGGNTSDSNGKPTEKKQSNFTFRWRAKFNDWAMQKLDQLGMPSHIMNATRDVYNRVKNMPAILYDTVYNRVSGNNSTWKEAFKEADTNPSKIARLFEYAPAVNNEKNYSKRELAEQYSLEKQSDDARNEGQITASGYRHLRGTTEYAKNIGLKDFFEPIRVNEWSIGQTSGKLDNEGNPYTYDVFAYDVEDSRKTYWPSFHNGEFTLGKALRGIFGAVGSLGYGDNQNSYTAIKTKIPVEKQKEAYEELYGD